MGIECQVSMFIISFINHGKFNIFFTSQLKAINSCCIERPEDWAEANTSLTELHDKVLTSIEARHGTGRVF